MKNAKWRRIVNFPFVAECGAEIFSWFGFLPCKCIRGILFISALSQINFHNFFNAFSSIRIYSVYLTLSSVISSYLILCFCKVEMPLGHKSASQSTETSSSITKKPFFTLSSDGNNAPQQSAKLLILILNCTNNICETQKSKFGTLF